jgi:hypothetical protein
MQWALHTVCHNCRIPTTRIVTGMNPTSIRRLSQSKIKDNAASDNDPPSAPTQFDGTEGAMVFARIRIRMRKRRRNDIAIRFTARQQRRIRTLESELESPTKSTREPQTETNQKN